MTITKKFYHSLVKPGKGFTLIELMVTIAIIAILAAVGMVVYSTAQKSGRMSRRIQDLKAIQAALETYKSIKGTYPNNSAVANNGGWRSSCSGWIGGDPNLVIPGLVPEFMPAFPVDPSTNGIQDSCYIYRSTTADGEGYKLLDCNVSEISYANDLPNFPRGMIDERTNLGNCGMNDAFRRLAVYSGDNYRCL